MHSLKKAISTIVVLCFFVVTVLGMIPPLGTVKAESMNLLQNPGFEADKANWTFTSTGTAANNVRTGLKHANIASGSSKKLSQQVTIPVTGSYRLSGWFSTGNSGATFGIKMAGGAVLQTVVLAANTTYTLYEMLDITLNKGDLVEVYVTGGSGWTNADDFSLIRDDSAMVNLVANAGFAEGKKYWIFTEGASTITEAVYTVPQSVYLEPGRDKGISQVIKVPFTGSYKLSAWTCAESTGGTLGIKKADGTEAGAGTIPEGSIYRKQTVEDIQLTANSDVVVYLTGGDGWVKADDFELTFDLAKFPNESPAASNAAITGKARVGTMLTGNYGYSDPEGHSEGASKYRWLISDTVDGEYQAIAGATRRTYIPTPAQEVKFIKFEVTPVDMYGKPGSPIVSSATEPVDFNVILNPGFELDRANWTMTGANIKNLGGSATMKPNKGLVHAYINPGAGNKLSQTVTIPRTGLYKLSAYSAMENSTGTGPNAVLGIKRANGEVIRSTPVQVGSAYTPISITDLILEENDQLEIYLSGGDGTVYADDFELVIDYSRPAPVFKNIISFEVEDQMGPAIIDKNTHTVTFIMPYGTDVSALLPQIRISEGAAILPEPGKVQDFRQPVTYRVKASDGTEQQWTVVCTVSEKLVRLDSSNTMLKDAFNWAVPKARSYIQTGKRGPINKNGATWGGQESDYIPSYWAGYAHRTAFYGRDFVHQTVGAHAIGLDTENYTMFKKFAEWSSESRKWYTLWAFNFDGSAYTVDYKSDTNFVREVPAQFELVEKAYRQYLWTGDSRYIEDPGLWNFYTKVLTDFIALHDTNGNGVAEGTGEGIFKGTCTYNERGDEKLIEAGDGIATQYQALLAYAGMQKAKGDNSGAVETLERANNLKKYFNETWSVKDNNAAGRYVRGWNGSGTLYDDFGKENSWFMPMKLITEPGERNNAYLDYIAENVGNGIGTTAGAPANIEAYTYLPDTFFPYHRNEEAWKWMKYIIGMKDKPHEVRTQGTNGDYPEISYTLIGHTIEGLMGIAPDAPQHKVSTVSRLPGEIGWLELKYLKLGQHEINVKQEGLSKTTLSHTGGPQELFWEVQFPGTYPAVKVNGQVQPAAVKTVNGVKVTYLAVTVPVGETVIAEAAGTIPGGIDKTELNNTIQAAEAKLAGIEEGTEAGQYHPGSATDLGEAIAAAKKTREEAATQEAVNRAVTALNQAAAKFDSRKITALTGDINTTPGIGIGDLSLVAGSYGKKIGSADWDAIKKADINGDGEIGIYDLSFIAKKIVQK